MRQGSGLNYGDKVVCISDHKYTRARFKKGEIYTYVRDGSSGKGAGILTRETDSFVLLHSDYRPYFEPPSTNKEATKLLSKELM